MEKDDRNNNNFRTLDGGSEKLSKQAVRRIPDTYAEVLAGDHGHPVKSESSYDNTELNGSKEGLGLTGSAGMNTNSGAYGDKGMTDTSDAFSATGGAGLPAGTIMDAMDSSTGLGNRGLQGNPKK